MEKTDEQFDVRACEEKLGVSFHNTDILKQAFTHRSYINEHRNINREHNERLEFLGDAVLELVVTDHLFNEYPNKAEGELTSLRSALVNTNTLATVAGELSMNDFLLLSKGEARDTGRARQYILANTFEAVVGAIYRDQDYNAAADFIGRNLFHRVDEIVEKRLWQDPKSRFQELAQERAGATPSYETLEESGPDHDKHFAVGVYVGDELIAKGTGKAKQEAEQNAAEAALAAKGWE